MTPEQRCEAREPSGAICGEPILVGKVCYDHAKLGPGDQPMCPITGEQLGGLENPPIHRTGLWDLRRALEDDR